MKMILSIPVIAVKAIMNILTGSDDLTEQLRQQQYKAQIMMMTLSR